jgi:hypothetical protein
LHQYSHFITEVQIKTVDNKHMRHPPPLLPPFSLSYLEDVDKRVPKLSHDPSKRLESSWVTAYLEDVDKRVPKLSHDPSKRLES